MILNDRQITEQCGMVSPFICEQVKEIPRFMGRERVISYGLSSFGYDVRLNDTFKVPKLFEMHSDPIVDPKDTDPLDYESMRVSQILVPPQSFVLGMTMERFMMPPDIMGICLGKSTYARCGIIVNTTPLEPGWEGYLTLEISNTNVKPVLLRAYEGIAQIIFLQGEKCDVTYADRNGKYQGQTEVTLPR